MVRVVQTIPIGCPFASSLAIGVYLFYVVKEVNDIPYTT
jgi:hypothetical protein